jgi:diguanylate cyclase (GGDEF)-like protein
MFDDANNFINRATHHGTQIQRKTSGGNLYHPVTGLLTHNAFEQCLTQALAPGAGDQREHALLYLGLDGLNTVAELHGHVAGEEMLGAVATRLRKFSRNNVLGHFAGDKFGLLLLGSGIQDAETLAQSIVREIDALKVEWDHKIIKVSICVGGIVTGATKDVRKILALAQTANRIAKQKRSRKLHIVGLEDATVLQWQDELLCVARLNYALEHDRFVLYQQPIVSLHPEISGPPQVELLARMIASDGSYVLPGAFIPAAEHFGVIEKLDRHLLERIFQILCYRNNQGLILPDQYSINVSGCNVSDAHFRDDLKTLITRYRISPDRLCFEITETAAISNMRCARRFVTEMRALGACVAIDDFGSGNASFHYLRDLPVDYLKVDGALIRDIANQTADRVMAEAICQMARTLGIKTVAECVENEVALECVQATGFDYAQGAVFSMPVPWLNCDALRDADLVETGEGL